MSSNAQWMRRSSRWRSASEVIITIKGEGPVVPPKGFTCMCDRCQKLIELAVKAGFDPDQAHQMEGPIFEYLRDLDFKESVRMADTLSGPHGYTIWKLIEANQTPDLQLCQS
jgi:hypothetical protein